MQRAAGANAKGSRRELDFYPTPPAATVALMDFLELHPDKTVWEPAAGTGDMSRVIESYGHPVFSSDIAPDCYGSGSIDFLHKHTFAPFDIDAIITNPPFNLSADFIEKALSITPTVAMLLKCQYWHAKSRLQLFDKYPPAWILPLTWRPDFLGGSAGGKPTMEVVWTVWLPFHKYTKYRPLSKPSG